MCDMIEEKEMSIIYTLKILLRRDYNPRCVVCIILPIHHHAEVLELYLPHVLHAAKFYVI